MTGEAAHITAASANGPRYDASLSAEARRDASNGIWLCRLCARIIDAKEALFSVQALTAWKHEAELEVSLQHDGAGRRHEALAAVQEAADTLQLFIAQRDLVHEFASASELSSQDRFPAWDRYLENNLRNSSLLRAQYQAEVVPTLQVALSKSSSMLIDQDVSKRLHSAVEAAGKNRIAREELLTALLKVRRILEESA